MTCLLAPRRLLLVLAVVLTACSSSQPESAAPEEPEPEEPVAPRLTLNDVSVLFPLPASPQATGYLGPASLGSRGELLPRAVYDAIPGFPVKPSQGLDYDRMRTVAVRFDGCQQTPTGCRPEIRMVMQPITDTGATLDSALHLFYALGEEELGAVTAALRELRALAPEVVDGPLDVHPALLAQGVEGPYGAGLLQLLLAYAGADNLVRMTFFLRAPPLQEVWFFGGFDRTGDQLQQLDIVGVGVGNQRVIRPEVAGGWAYELTPDPVVPEDGRALLSSAAADAADAEARAAAFASYLRVENPGHYAPDALPCAGCHLAGYVTAEARARYGLSDEAFPADAFVSEHDLSVRGGAAATPSSLRAFGWFDRDPMIAPRVVHESAEVADDLEARFPAQ